MKWLPAAAAGIAAFVFSAIPARAQVIQLRPVPALFRTTSDPALSRDQIDFSTFLSGGYETATTVQETGAPDPFTDENGFGNVVMHGRYAHKGHRKTFGADGGTTTSYYSRTGEFSPVTTTADVHFEGAYGRKGTFSLRQSAFYSPYYALAPFASTDGGGAAAGDDAGSAPALDPRVDLRSTRFSTKGYSTFAALEQQVSRRGYLQALYEFHYIDLARGLPDRVSHVPSIGYKLKYSRYGSFTARYALQTFAYAHSGYPALHSNNIGLGIVYERPLTDRHPLSVGFQTGTAIVQVGGVSRFYLTGNAHVNRKLSRGWVTGASYLRNQQVLEGFQAPYLILADSVAGSLSGRLFRQLRLTTTVAYTHGTFNVGTLSNGFDTVLGSARLDVPIMWLLSFTSQVYYSDYDFQERLGLLDGIPGTVHRLGGRAGLTFNVPVLR